MAGAKAKKTDEASAILDFNAAATKRELFARTLVRQIDAALESETERSRAYIGASAIGDDCQRRVQYEVWEGFHPDDKETTARALPHDGRTKRIFARGARLENTMADWLRAAGLDLATVNVKTGYPFGFSVAQGHFRGHVDGIVRAGIEGQKAPAIWENKVVNAKNFKAIVSNGLAKAFPKYADQIAIYQAYLDLTEEPALFTALNADTCEVWAEQVPFDAKRAQDASDRAVMLVTKTRARMLMPRATTSREMFPCPWCRFREACW